MQENDKNNPPSEIEPQKITTTMRTMEESNKNPESAQMTTTTTTMMVNNFNPFSTANSGNSFQQGQLLLQPTVPTTTNTFSSLSSLSNRDDSSSSNNNKYPRDSVILEEQIEPDYEPTQEDILEYAQFLGMDPIEDKDLLWIAHDGLKMPLPSEWKPCRTIDTDELYYFNFQTGASVWSHPLDSHFRNLYQVEKAKKQHQEFESASPRRKQFADRSRSPSINRLRMSMMKVSKGSEDGSSLNGGKALSSGNSPQISSTGTIDQQTQQQQQKEQQIQNNHEDMININNSGRVRANIALAPPGQRKRGTMHHQHSFDGTAQLDSHSVGAFSEQLLERSPYSRRSSEDDIDDEDDIVEEYVEYDTMDESPRMLQQQGSRYRRSSRGGATGQGQQQQQQQQLNAKYRPPVSTRRGSRPSPIVTNSKSPYGGLVNNYQYDLEEYKLRARLAEARLGDAEARNESLREETDRLRSSIQSVRDDCDRRVNSLRLELELAVDRVKSAEYSRDESERRLRECRFEYEQRERRLENEIVILKRRLDDSTVMISELNRKNRIAEAKWYAAPPSTIGDASGDYGIIADGPPLSSSSSLMQSNLNNNSSNNNNNNNNHRHSLLRQLSPSGGFPTGFAFPTGSMNHQHHLHHGSINNFSNLSPRSEIPSSASSPASGVQSRMSSSGNGLKSFHSSLIQRKYEIMQLKNSIAQRLEITAHDLGGDHPNITTQTTTSTNNANTSASNSDENRKLLEEESKRLDEELEKIMSILKEDKSS